jgi:hypothetical protein
MLRLMGAKRVLREALEDLGALLERWAERIISAASPEQLIEN